MWTVNFDLDTSGIKQAPAVNQVARRRPCWSVHGTAPGFPHQSLRLKQRDGQTDGRAGQAPGLRLSVNRGVADAKAMVWSTTRGDSAGGN